PPHVDAVATATRRALAGFGYAPEAPAVAATPPAPAPFPQPPAPPHAADPEPAPAPVSLLRNAGSYGVLAALLALFLPASAIVPPRRLARPVKAMLRLMFRVAGWRVRVTGAER